MNPGNVAGPLLLVLGLLILRRRPAHAMGRLYLGSGAMLVVFSVVNDTSIQQHVPSGLALAGAWYASWAWAVGPLLVGTFGLLLLPDGRLPGPRWRWLAWASVAGMLSFVVGMPYDSDGTLRTAMPEAFAPAAEVVLLAGFVLAPVTLVASLAAPVVRLRRGDPRVRQQLGLVVAASAFAVVLFLAQDVLVTTLRISHDVLLTIGIATIPIAVATAILRHGLFEVHRLVGRVLTYSVVAAALGVTYLGLVLGLGTAARALTGESGDLVVAVSTLAVAALFQPVRRRVQGVVDRRFNRSRYDAARTLGAFGRGLRDEVSLGTISSELRAVTAATFGPQSVGLLLVDARPVGKP